MCESRRGEVEGQRRKRTDQIRSNQMYHVGDFPSILTAYANMVDKIWTAVRPTAVATSGNWLRVGLRSRRFRPLGLERYCLSSGVAKEVGCAPSTGNVRWSVRLQVRALRSLRGDSCRCGSANHQVRLALSAGVVGGNRESHHTVSGIHYPDVAPEHTTEGTQHHPVRIAPSCPCRDRTMALRALGHHCNFCT